MIRHAAKHLPGNGFAVRMRIMDVRKAGRVPVRATWEYDRLTVEYEDQTAFVADSQGRVHWANLRKYPTTPYMLDMLSRSRR